ncbi:MAG: DUF3006 domain-containing protein [Clostridia bacterium]|nr:DUF3006 domain-containing protein [Clostridia bacterium]
MAIKLSVDRICNDIAICYDDECKKYEIPSYALKEGDMVSAEFDSSGNFISATPLPEETEARRKELASKTKMLFNRNKKSR